DDPPRRGRRPAPALPRRPQARRPPAPQRLEGRQRGLRRHRSVLASTARGRGAQAGRVAGRHGWRPGRPGGMSAPGRAGPRTAPAGGRAEPVPASRWGAPSTARLLDEGVRGEEIALDVLPAERAPHGARGRRVVAIEIEHAETHLGPELAREGATPVGPG